MDMWDVGLELDSVFALGLGLAKRWRKGNGVQDPVEYHGRHG